MNRLLFSTTLAVGLLMACSTSLAQSSHDTGGELIELYRTLHTNPELSFEEVETSGRLASELRSLGFAVTTGMGAEWVEAKALRDQGEIRDNVGGHGVVGIFENGDGPTILLRTDMDALPVPEQTGLEYASQVIATSWTGVESSVMHACGHDVHMTTWVGTARALIARKDEWQGTLIMIAQPAEELGLGALAMLEDGLYQRFGVPDANLALHVSAGLPAGKVGYSKGYALANVDSIDIIIHGVGGHGAYPHTTRDPIMIGAHIVTALQTLVSRNVDPQKPAVVTIGAFNAGTKHNIISDQAHLKLTVRSYDETTRTLLLEGIDRITRAQAAAFGAPEPEITRQTDYTPSTYNDPDLTDQSIAAITQVIGATNVLELTPVMGGEDFSEYGRTDENVPGLIYWLGAVDADVWAAAQENGTSLPSLHSPFFKPDAEFTIITGVKAMTAAALAAFQAPQE